MNISVKIRILLTLLCATLILTAVVIRQLYTPQANLDQSARVLEKNLHQKESLVYNLINSDQFNELKTFGQHEEEALKFIQNITLNKRVWAITLVNGKLRFWSGIKVLPNDAEAVAIKEGSSFIKQPNGYYEVIKKSEGNFSTLFFIPVKSDYILRNQYLKNTIDRDLLTDDNLEIADFTDKQVRTIQSVKHTYLFSVKLKNNIQNFVFVGYEIALWTAILLLLFLLINNLANHYARKGKILTGASLIILFIILLRFINLSYHYPYAVYALDLFNSAYYHSNNLYPSLGDLCLNTLLLTWLAAFLYYYRYKLLLHPHLSRPITQLIFIVGTCLLAIALTQALNLFANVVINTALGFDIENVLNLSAFGVLAAVMLCFCFLALFLLTDAFLTVANKLPLPEKQKLYLLAGTIVVITIISSWYNHSPDWGFLLWGVIMIIRGYAIIYTNGNFNPFAFISLVIICSLIASLTFNEFRALKEKEVRKTLIHKLENNNDPSAKQMFDVIEKRITNDHLLTDYFSHHEYNNEYLKNHFQHSYFDGYLADYDFKISEFDADGKPVSAGNEYALADFKDMVVYSSIKVSNYFYRENDAFGYKRYFAIIPLYQQGQLQGTITIELKSKPLAFSYSFPQILANNNEIAYNNAFKEYSYAFYRDNELQSQNGKYIYNIVNTKFKGKLHEYAFANTRDNNEFTPWYKRLTLYSHLIYQPSKQKLIIVTREDNFIFEGITSLTFFFVLLLTFSLLVLFITWIWARVRFVSIRNNQLHWGIKIRFNRLLYKTRIQLSMIFAVVLTLMMVAIVTYFSIRSQYLEQQDDMMIERAGRISAAFENNLADRLEHNAQHFQVQFNEFASNYSTDLVLFSTNGSLLLSTQPKIYDYGLITPRISAKPYLLLHNLQQSVVVNDEHIGTLNYKAVYAPIRNSKNETIAYVQLPYFSNEADYRERIGSLLNAMINIYALIFIAIGLLAVIIARQITAPLSYIQHSLSRTIYGQKNEPIAWGDRNDEIGALVKEYNNMIAALEQSASRLAQSERESAWREMAKQVAHEIKNPLTPLKLGLQLLEKSWKDKDPKFDSKFERFSKSFVEQIESLSSIASEFSAFAKMPDTRMERLNVLETLAQAVTIFKHMENVKITYHYTETDRFPIIADRDQLLRCFNNLLKNAIEAMPHGQTGIIDISYTINSNNILLKLSDNGNGIPENLRERIFEPNFTTKSSGTGLGLAFVKNSIENARGNVWFETQTGLGTTFYISLPKSRI